LQAVRKKEITLFSSCWWYSAACLLNCLSWLKQWPQSQSWMQGGFFYKKKSWKYSGVSKYFTMLSQEKLQENKHTTQIFMIELM
jgi:phage major head subunit gpT-like protein